MAELSSAVMLEGGDVDPSVDMPDALIMESSSGLATCACKKEPLPFLSVSYLHIKHE
jgi:hypothetical protein